MGVTMIISFWTTRELLFILGVKDFGLANVIGGVAGMFSFVASTMQATMSRFFSYEIGKNSSAGLRAVFGSGVYLYSFLFLFVLILAETAGLYFFNEHVALAAENKAQYFLFYHASVGVMAFGLLTSPFSSLLISHENIRAYSILAILESALKLFSVYFLGFFESQYLVLYGIFCLFVAVFLFFVNFVFCYKKYSESRPSYCFDKVKLKSMLSFAAWNLWGALTGLFSNVFVNVLLNNYFGPVVNAARAVAMQGSSGISSFVTNFMTAARPLIIKYYAEGKYDSVSALTMRVSKYSYFLLYVIAFPVLFEIDFLLAFWLKTVPDNAGFFLQLIIAQRLLEIMTYSIVTLSHAVGKVALYQTVVGVTQWLILPISWVLFENGFRPESTFFVNILLTAFLFVVQVFLINRLIPEFKISDFFWIAVVPTVKVTVFTLAAGFLLKYSVFATLAGELFFIFILVLLVIGCVYALGLDGNEREQMFRFLEKKIRK
jgi:O-antigen/teichoic acid export membrane protein